MALISCVRSEGVTHGCSNHLQSEHGEGKGLEGAEQGGDLQVSCDFEPDELHRKWCFLCQRESKNPVAQGAFCQMSPFSSDVSPKRFLLLLLFYYVHKTQDETCHKC